MRITPRVCTLVLSFAIVLMSLLFREWYSDRPYIPLCDVVVSVMWTLYELCMYIPIPLLCLFTRYQEYWYTLPPPLCDAVVLVIWTVYVLYNYVYSIQSIV